MKFWSNGYAYTVECTAGDVSMFASAWPCFGEVKALWFQFDVKSGDLIDMGDSSGMDEQGVVALSHDAQKYGLEKLAQLNGGTR